MTQEIILVSIHKHKANCLNKMCRTVIRLNVFILFVYFTDNFFLLCSALPTQSDNRLAVCQNQPSNSTLTSISVVCNVTKGQILDYRDLRQWSANEKDRKCSVTINCDGGLVYLPWPFKARNVMRLEVHKCTVLGFFSEMTMDINIPDELKTLILSDITVEIPFGKILELRNDNGQVSRSADCGQLTLETLIFKRIHYDLKMSPEERDGIRHQTTLVDSQTGHSTPHEPCIYKNLKVLDESGSRRSGQYHLKLVPEYSQFPALEVYNMSDNEMDHVPETFRNLHSGKFPALRHIDFSKNFLRRFEFDFPKDPHSCKLEIVDLHDNMIDSISPQTTEQLNIIGNILVDLRHNPLKCDCRLAPFRNYLEIQYRKTSDTQKRQLVSTITCSNSSSLPGEFKEVALLNLRLDNKCNR